MLERFHDAMLIVVLVLSSSVLLLLSRWYPHVIGSR